MNSSKAEVRARVVSVDGIRSPVLEAGPANSGEAVLFVHGNPGSSRDWSDLVSRVGTFCRAVAIDLPGFGQADKPAGFDYTVAGFARHLALVQDTLGILRTHLVLHDFGGPFGLAWAAAHPNRLGSLTLIDTGVLIGYRWHLVAQLWRLPLVGEVLQKLITRRRFHGVLNRRNPRPLPPAFLDRMFDDYDRRTRQVVLWLYRATNRADVVAGSAVRADVPVLVVWGQHDSYIPVRFAHQQRQTFPGARVFVLPDAGHWPFIDAPDAVADEVVPFLREVVSKATSRNVVGR
jgi:pimeloyl-ACP methyl ester carboxylesterase